MANSTLWYSVKLHLLEDKQNIIQQWVSPPEIACPRQDSSRPNRCSCLDWLINAEQGYLWSHRNPVWQLLHSFTTMFQEAILVEQWQKPVLFGGSLVPTWPTTGRKYITPSNSFLFDNLCLLRGALALHVGYQSPAKVFVSSFLNLFLDEFRKQKAPWAFPHSPCNVTYLSVYTLLFSTLLFPSNLKTYPFLHSVIRQATK